MINFSEISKNNLLSGRDNIIRDVVSRSGVSEQRISKMYDIAALNYNGDEKKIFESFEIMLNKPKFDDKIFKNLLLDLQKDIDASVDNVEARNKATHKMIGVVENFAKHNDTPKLIEIISFILSEKNTKFDKIAETIDFGKDIKKMFESQQNQNDAKLINFSNINISKHKTGDLNKSLAQNDKQLYESLRDILSRNNKRWGHNYHLDNVYSTITNFLDEEIKELSNENAIFSIEDTFHEKLLHELVYGRQLNQMYCSINYLKDLVPDLQTLCFDLMIFVNSYVMQNREIVQYFNRDLTHNYYESMYKLYQQFYSSERLSRIIDRKHTTDNEDLYSKQQKFDYGKFMIDYAKYDIARFRIKPEMAYNAIKIIFSCQPEFTLKTRKYINAYVTAASNLVISMNKKIMHARKPIAF